MTTYRFEQIAENIRVPVMPEPEDSARYIGLEHLDSGSLRVRRWGTDVTLIGQKLQMKKGEILFARRNAYLRRVAVAPFDGIFSAHGMVLRAKEKVCLLEFLPVFMQSDYFMDRAIKISVGSLSPTINWSALKKEEFELPPIEEQRRIADLLWATDDVAERWEIAREGVLKLIESTLKTYFDETKVQNDKGKWKNVLLEKVAYVQTGIAKGKKYSKEIETIELPYLSVLNVQDGYLDLNGIKAIVLPKADIDKYRLYEGDIIITEGGDADKLGRGTLWRGEIDLCLHQNHIFCIRTNKEKLLPEFLSFQMRSVYGKKYFFKCAKKTSNLASINSTQVKQFPVLLCSIEDQKEMILSLSQLEKTLEQVSSHLSQTRDLKKNFLKKLISGQAYV